MVIDTDSRGDTSDMDEDDKENNNSFEILVGILFQFRKIIIRYAQSTLNCLAESLMIMKQINLLICA